MTNSSTNRTTCVLHTTIVFFTRTVSRMQTETNHLHASMYLEGNLIHTITRMGSQSAHLLPCEELRNLRYLDLIT